MGGKLISFNGVASAARRNKQLLLRRFTRVLERGVFLNGRENTELERELTRFLGRGFLTTVASGHDALCLSLLALGFSPADEVIVPANAYPTAFPVILAGAKLVLADVDDNGQLTLQTMKAALTPNTKAVIVVHLYGLVGEIDGVRRLCRQKKLVLIEDAAQAFGSIYRGKPVGTIGDIGCFSFYPTKNLAALGDGGAVWTKNKKVFNYVIAAKQYGEKIRYKSQFVAGHSRLPELAAAGLNLYLRSLPKEIKQRRKLAAWYYQELSTAGLDGQVRSLTSDPNSQPAPHLLVIETQKRDRLKRYLQRRKIPTMVHYPTSIHLVPAFKFLGKKRGSFPVAERLAKNILSLPFHPYLSRRQIRSIIKEIKNFYTHLTQVCSPSGQKS